MIRGSVLLIKRIIKLQSVAKNAEMELKETHQKTIRARNTPLCLFRLEKKVWRLGNSATQGFKICSTFKGVKQDLSCG